MGRDQRYTGMGAGIDRKQRARGATVSELRGAMNIPAWVKVRSTVAANGSVERNVLLAGSLTGENAVWIDGQEVAASRGVARVHGSGEVPF